MKTTQDLIDSVSKTYQEGLGLIERKNKDYAGNGDPFQNFRACTAIGVTPEKALLVRIMDKITRISNLLEREGQVKDEAIEDTCLDLVNYAAILKAYLEDKCKKSK